MSMASSSRSGRRDQRLPDHRAEDAPNRPARRRSWPVTSDTGTAVLTGRPFSNHHKHAAYQSSEKTAWPRARRSPCWHRRPWALPSRASPVRAGGPGPWSTMPQRLAEPGVLARRLAVAADRHLATLSASLSASPGLAAGPVEFPGRRFVRALVTVRSCCRRWSAVSRCCWCWAAKVWSQLLAPPSDHAAVHHRRRRRRRGLRGDAVSGHRRRGALRGADPAMMEPAAPWVPAVDDLHPRDTAARRARVAGRAVLFWPVALGRVRRTITFAGNFPRRTQTMPLAVYLALETDLQAAIVLSLILLAVSVTILGRAARQVDRRAHDHTRSPSSTRTYRRPRHLPARCPPAHRAGEVSPARPQRAPADPALPPSPGCIR